ncbi:MAG: flagellar export protein FliJ [Hyphomicrobiaceae bacterium]|nr:flagellar export protein FliJ [Hyphomicrobiaceae bacterium]
MKSRESLIRLKRFQVDEKRRTLSQIERMMADFERMAAELDREVEIEQQKAGVTDVAHYAYPTYAKAAAARRDNLRESAENLKGQLEQAQNDLAEAVEELKKVELLEERDQDRDRIAQEDAERAAMEEAERARRYRAARIG